MTQEQAGNFNRDYAGDGLNVRYMSVPPPVIPRPVIKPVESFTYRLFDLEANKFAGTSQHLKEMLRDTAEKSNKCFAEKNFRLRWIQVS
jgi:hypothetical protein